MIFEWLHHQAVRLRLRKPEEELPPALSTDIVYAWWWTVDGQKIHIRDLARNPELRGLLSPNSQAALEQQLKGRADASGFIRMKHRNIQGMK